MESVKETWATINDFARAHTGVNSSDEPDGAGMRKDTSDTESQSKVNMFSLSFLLLISDSNSRSR